MLDTVFLILQCVGVFSFSITGTIIAIQKKADFIGGLFFALLTSFGGGMLRDVLTNSMPMVLREHIYAVASLSGALLYYILLSNLVPATTGAVISCVFIFTLRMLATFFNWNLPRVKR